MGQWVRLCSVAEAPQAGSVKEAEAAGVDVYKRQPQTEAKLESMILGAPAAERTRSAVMEQANNPTAQRQAEQNFNARPVSDAENAEMAPGFAAAGNGKNAGRRNGGQGGFNLSANQPETPLDTMAGLLLGSPEFQRR